MIALSDESALQLKSQAECVAEWKTKLLITQFRCHFNASVGLTQKRKNSPFRKMKTLFFVVSCLGAVLAVPQDPPVLGNWALDDCILAQFSMNITIFPDHKNPNKTTTVTIPNDAQVDPKKSTCGDMQKNQDQILTLSWKDKVNETIDLEREIMITFRRNLNAS